MYMQTDKQQADVKQAYLNLRKAIMECEQHPDDEFYELSEMHANEVYDDALEALILARMEEKRRAELSGELPF